ncbi:structure-specific endonuclease subunit SLX1 homolog [Aedes aegypti]|uniref:Structure-specific endonuclease subunit SLX1 homolog n=2 Tax=Aedes aegypti TaxID=7159 RepID=A0A1S4G7M6_AEDAE|nr:structure-specific endonuclease subunit SLX1 homolog [Aedes aegypti]XP_021707417.1 structure-specific endonuclease subunit SLX1 homolog [Aedes aegypti]
MASQIPQVQEIEDFYGVYLLVSKSINPKFAGRTYIGYTVDPNRRIKQHNGGQDAGGAKRTSNRGPWVMVMIVHGFPNNISALRFEWAWQQPKVSRRLKQIPELQRKQRKESNFEYNFRILTEMLRIGPWNRLPLTVRWLADDFHREFEIGKVPPMHMPICFGRVKKVPKKGKAPKKATQRRRRKTKRGLKSSGAELMKNSKSMQTTVNDDCVDDVDEYDLLVMGAKGKEVANRDFGGATIDDEANDDNDDITISSSSSNDENEQQPLMELVSDDCVICNGQIRSGGHGPGEGFALRCIQPRCKLICHIECLAERCLEPGQYVPVEGSCPICNSHFLWGDLIRKANGCSDLVEDASNTGLFEVDDVSDCDGD